MNKLQRCIDRFCVLHPNFGIHNLMKVIIIGQAAAYLLDMFSSMSVPSVLCFSLSALLQGEIWRLITFVFVPNASTPISFLILLSFYYFVGNSLEREWGTAKFNIYYISGLLFSVLGTVIASLLTSQYGLVLYNAYYLNLTLFLAFAVLYPDARVLLYFIIPLKASWIAIADVVLFLAGIVQAASQHDIVGIVLPIIALLNFCIFFAADLGSFAKLEHKRSQQASHFHNAVKQQQREQKAQGYRHKCAVCGRTDAEYPDLRFRYCSKCAGYHCFCEDHIFNHVHFTDENS